MNLIQLQHPTSGRRVGLVQEPFVILLDPSVTSTYQFFKECIALAKSVCRIYRESFIEGTAGIQYDL